MVILHIIGNAIISDSIRCHRTMLRVSNKRIVKKKKIISSTMTVLSLIR